MNSLKGRKKNMFYACCNESCNAYVRLPLGEENKGWGKCRGDWIVSQGGVP